MMTHMHPTIDEEFVGTAEVARLLGCSPSTVRRRVESHELEPVHTAPGGPHGAFVFKREDVEHLRAEKSAS